MPAIKASCPSCGAALSVSEEAVGKAGRCPTCGRVFKIPAPTTAASEEDVLSWLDGDGQWRSQEAPAAHVPSGPTRGTPAQSAPSAPARAEPARAGSSRAPTSPAQAGASAGAPAGGAAPAGVGPASPPREVAPSPERGKKPFAVRLGHVDDMGAFFLFQPNLLYDEDFRTAFGQCCIGCGKTGGLSVHLIIWSSKLPQRGQFGTKTSFSRSVIDLDQLGGRRGRKLLEVLPTLANLPQPFCLPMPYYVCQTCSPVGVVVTDVRQGPDGGEVCELGIASLAQAQAFIAGLAGEDSAACQAVGRAIRQRDSNPWFMLPLAVRSRINQWYKPTEGERFVAYVPDNDFARTEAGMAGLVLTDWRLVYHKFAALVDVPLKDGLSVQVKAAVQKTCLYITGQSGTPAILSADPAAMELLRDQLRRRGVNVRWAE